MSHAAPTEPERGQDLLAQLGRVIVGGEQELSSAETLTPEAHLWLVRRSAEAHGATADLLQQAVGSARAAGVSWARLGEELGLSRQGAQQRFGPATEVADDADEDVRWLGPVTAVDEMGELQLAGELGWHTVEAGMFRHRMVRTATQWEHRRVVWTRPARHYLTDGWEVGARAFPWLYLVRDTGRSAATG
ncbi:hypothetical protein [Serinicoccus kebangsaanensis]|uniref:hypothetical protein n=1 Tax=Serinicoccus kebangsaanensis TaxID=2602069 RepID=UPI001EE2BAD6|nr:hypothetical protein [Serinicoccus kebangsaanensis]